MGKCNSPDIFQDDMNKMFRGIEFIRAYIDDLLIITQGDYSYHLNKLKLFLQNIKENRFKLNIEK